jgi:hypothetical protein
VRHANAYIILNKRTSKTLGLPLSKLHSQLIPITTCYVIPYNAMSSVTHTSLRTTLSPTYDLRSPLKVLYHDSQSRKTVNKNYFYFKFHNCNNHWKTPSIYIFFYHAARAHSGPRPPHQAITIPLTHATLDRTPLDERPARRRDLYLTTYSTHNRQTSVLLAGIEPTIPASERPQTDALARAATGIGI